MATITEIDPYYIKAITALHSGDHLQGGKPTLQVMLEEAIKAKTGVEKNFTPLIQTILKQGLEDYKNLTPVIEESKTTSSSDNELELDLLKEDLMCIVCQGMDVGARNRLLECSDCHSLYHQECHQPNVTQQDADGTWVCHTCKETKRLKKSPTSSSSSHSSSKSKNSPATTPRHGSSGYKSSSSKSSSSKGSGKSSKSSSSSSSSSSGSSRHSVTPTVNIISSADKRLQIMKKKAAKLHEKKKLPR